MMNIFLLLIGFLSDNILQILCQKQFQPYGPKMCHILCKKKVNVCSEYTFDNLQLICLISANSCQQIRQSSYRNNREGGGSAQKIAPRQAEKNSSSLEESVCLPENVKEFLHFVDKKDLEGVKSLVCKGVVDVNCHIERGGLTGVMSAASNNDIIMFDFLVEQKCDLSAIDDYNGSVIHYASAGNSVNIIKKLKDQHNINVDQRGCHGRTPLMYTVDPQSIDAFKFLVERGADVNAVDHKGNTVLHIATAAYSKKLVDYILSQNVIDIDSRGENGMTPLMVAVKSNDITLVKLVKDNGADVLMVDDDNNTVLHLACKCNNIKLVKYILSWNTIDIESKGEKGRTPLMIAVVRGTKRTAGLLRHRGAKMFQRIRAK